MTATLSNIPGPDAPAVLSRRHIFAGAAAIGAALVAAACGSDNDDGAPAATSPSTGGTTTPTEPATTMSPPTTMGSDATAAPAGDADASVAMLAAGLEVLAVQTYQAALDAAGSGALGQVPPAVAEFVTVAMAQHQEHLDTWNSVITRAGGNEVTAPNATLKPTVDEALGKATDVAGAAALALQLEQIASATYLSAQNVLTSEDAIELAGSMQIIDAQHASILLYVLGEYPVPDVFAKVELAASA